MKQTAVLIGRFQPFHKGHHALVQEVMSDFASVFVGIAAVSDERTARNPLTIPERQQCLNTMALSCATGVISQPKDCEAGVTEVKDHVDDEIVAVGCNDETLSCFERQGHLTQAYGLHQPSQYDGLRIRELARSGRSWNNRVPEPVLDVLSEIGFTEILQSLTHPEEAQSQ